MAYSTVFDITQDGFQWWIPFVMFISSSLFVLIGWGVRTLGDKDSFTRGLIFQLAGVVGILGAFFFLAYMYAEYRAARKAFATHDYSVIEGTVSNFTPMPRGGHSTESFVLNGVRFDYVNSEWNKGFVHNGVQARISYVGKDIIRVEVK